MEEELEDLKSKQKKELKQLQNDITKLKKSTDKKKKKGLLEQIDKMENEIKERHIAEFNALELKWKDLKIEKTIEDVNVEKLEPDVNSNDNSPSFKQKKNRQQERKLRKKAEQEKIYQEALNEASTQIDYRSLEQESINDLLSLMKLKIKEIDPDGHCLYNAIIHQLSISKNNSVEFDYKQLRSITSKFIYENKLDFLPFLLNNNGEILNDDEFEKYCNDLKDTAVWGGQPEINALSQYFKREIHVVQMGSPVLKIGEGQYAESSEPIKIS
ncbi:OTU domain-containing protein 6B [Lobulomyces angularis]|nr:OTU domain-containing protein 6B [Lobulomyces angularis]